MRAMADCGPSSIHASPSSKRFRPAQRSNHSLRSPRYAPVSLMPTRAHALLFSSRRRHTRCSGDWSSDVCSSDLFFEDEERWRAAAVKGRASEFIETLPSGYRTQLGKWFREGRELSGGQWQKIALSRAFMRTRADILVLDEPTAAMDAQAEAEVFEHFRQLARERITILISHRFSTVRMADQIAVLARGRIIEHGSHEELMKLNGRYAQLFTLQARGYR